MHSFIDNRLRILRSTYFSAFSKISIDPLSFVVSFCAKGSFQRKKQGDPRNMTIQKIDVNSQGFRTVPHLQCLTVHVPLLLKLPRHIPTI